MDDFKDAVLWIISIVFSLAVAGYMLMAFSVGLTWPFWVFN